MATISITISAAHVNRARTAYGKYLNLTDGNGNPRDATAAEVKQDLINRVKQITFDQEDRAANEARPITEQIDPT